MEDSNDLESLQLLHSDLLALSESRLYNVDRLWAQLEARVAEFRQLLDKSSRTEQSRAALSTGMITVSDVEYEINDQFQQNALQVSTDLDLDELESARLVLLSSDGAESMGRSIVESAVIRFHQRRQYLLDCYRLILQQANEIDGNGEEASTLRDAFQNAVNVILEGGDMPGSGSRVAHKCLQHMADIKNWLQAISDRFSGASVLGQSQTTNMVENLEYQRVSLIRQHESLGMIIYHLAKGGHSVLGDFEHCLDIVKRIDKYDNLLVHYFPAIGIFISIFGGVEGASLREARRLHEQIMGNGSEGWALHFVHAAIVVWWLGEYSGRYGEGVVGSPLVNVNLDDESRTRSRQFSDALKDGAFDFLLSLSADVKSIDWLDPARHGLRHWLQRKAPALSAESLSFSSTFQDALMEQLESFIDAFISNMPDVLRRLRTDEDEQRQLSQTHEHDLDLERFLVIISYAFESRADAALSLFWADPESNLAGFLQWASRRASTPLMSAFCEMLQALSESDECASAAHEFLLDEGSAVTGKIRRNQSLTWSQIFRELKFFTEKIRDPPAISQSTIHRSGKPDGDVAETEPESAMMLESYLRLITRLCSESSTAKQFLLKHPHFHILEILYQLASSAVPSRLRACAFTTLRSLTTHKTREEGEFIWTTLDVWISGGYSPASSLVRGAGTASSSLQAMNVIFHEISTGFEEPDAFIQLLTALISPYEDDNGLDDCIPFPESLGSANRMPGIDPYVDFAMKDVFAVSSSESNTAQLRLIRLSCLTFIRTCLSTFNEDLVILANQSSIPVDEAIRTSNLSAYICLHPFARVMEWCFNDKVMSVLFECIHQDPNEIAKSAPDSPLVLSLLQAIEVVTLVLKLQSTYLNIVRPAVKMQPTHRRNVVANTAFASFEDGMLNKFSIFSDLGLFVGVGHSDLTLASLELLQKLSISPKFNSTTKPGNTQRLGRNKVIASIESANEADRIAQALLNELVSPTDVELGPESIAFRIKSRILDFLIACLDAVWDEPSIAHLLLGFHCGPGTVDIRTNSPFGRRDSIFHATVDFVGDALIGDEVSGVSSSLISLRSKGLHLLHILWRSPLTSRIVMSELRDNNFLLCLVVKEVVVNTGTSWEGRDLDDPEFLSDASSGCLSQFLASRSAILQYAAAEMRAVSQEQSPSLRDTILGTLLGTTTADDGQKLRHASIFDLFDFMELDFPPHAAMPNIPLLQDLDLTVCTKSIEGSSPMFDLAWAQELAILRKSDLIKRGRLVGQNEETAYDIDVQLLMTHLSTKNHVVLLYTSFIQALRAWVQLMLIIIKLGGLDGINKTEFVLRAFQVILPKLEKYSTQSIDEALELAKLSKLLIFSLDFTSDTFLHGDLGDLASDKLFELFRLSLRAIHSPIANAALKETLYCISCHYLSSMSVVLKGSEKMRRHSVHTIKAAGERLLDVVCDDAYAGEQNCRVSAILLLCEFLDLAALEDSKYMIDSLIRLNCLTLMVDSVGNIAAELHESPHEEFDPQLTYYNAKLALLLRVSQTRFGAGAVLNAGLFQSVKASALFASDPDIGIGSFSKKSVEKHYKLLLVLMRVINAAVLSRGQQNQQVMAQGRHFLSENRLSVTVVFKRLAKLGSADGLVSDDVVEELAEAFILLISLTNFLEFEDESQPRKRSSLSFT